MAEESLKELGMKGNSEAELSALIKKNQKSRSASMGDFFSSLEEKYAKIEKKGKSKQEGAQKTKLGKTSSKAKRRKM